MQKQVRNILLIVGFIISLSACKKDELVTKKKDKITPGEGLADWTEETHSNSTNPNYDVVFNQKQVNRIDLVLTEQEFNTMQTDLATLAATAGGPDPGGAGGGFSEENPVYVACDFYFNGVQWYNVGLRYKGNSSLFNPFKQGIKKLPLRLKFDKFEDEFPEIKNQRFYGFKDLSLGSNYDDESAMREKTASDLFREFGVPAPLSSFYEVYIDVGNGPIYHGLYTMLEVVSDAMLMSQFGSESGNCYKPDGSGAAFASSGFNLEHFEKKTNEKSADWTDIQELHTILHSSLRNSNTELWKDNLEAVFDVNGFLKYLAINNTIQNWDTYGNMTHNYYLYHDPADDLIKWIVWDNNEAFKADKKPPLSFSMSEVGSEWPLISYIITVDEYEEKYRDYIQDFISSSFALSKMQTQISNTDNIISSSANKESAEYSFINGNYGTAVSELKNHCEQRFQDASDFLK